MANTKSAEKRNRKTLDERERNRGQRSRMRGAVKILRQTIQEGDAKQAAEMLPATLRLIDATAQKKVIHRNVAARTKSRLSKAFSGLQG